MKNPPHPGDFIRTEIVIPTGLTATAAALQVSHLALSSLLDDKADRSGEIGAAHREGLRSKDAYAQGRMQSSYDIAKGRKREKQIHIRRIRQPADARA